MRSNEFSTENPNQISPKDAKSVEPEPFQKPFAIVLVPISCRCLVAVDDGGPSRHGHDIEVTVNGIVVGDANVDFNGFTSDRQWIVTKFDGTVPVFTQNGILPAIELVQNGDIEIWGRGLKGRTAEVDIDIGDTVTMVERDGKIFQLIGADR